MIAIPPRPVEPDLGKKPRALVKAERNWDKYKVKEIKFLEQYPGEFCSGCCALIGKDYGSYSHSCEGRRLASEYYAPRNKYGSELHKWERQKLAIEVANRLIELDLVSATDYSSLEDVAMYTARHPSTELLAEVLDLVTD